MVQRLIVANLAFILIGIGCTPRDVVRIPTGYGGIVGCVFDGVCGTGCSLTDANIVLENTQLGTTTKINGRFQCVNIPVGNYNIFSQKIGYRRTRILNVRVASDSVTILQFALTPVAIPEDPIDKNMIESELNIRPIGTMFFDGKLINLSCENK